MKMFRLFDLIKLSMCSLKTRKWIKALRIHRKELNIRVVFRESDGVNIVNEPANECVWLRATPLSMEMEHSVKLENSAIPMCYGNQGTEYYMDLYFDDKIHGFKVITEFICSLFRKDVSKVYLLSSLNPSDPQKIMEWVIGRQKSIQSFHIQCENTSDTVAEYLLDNVNHANKAFIDLKLTTNFKANFKFDGERFDILQGLWFTLDNLMSINCCILFVKGSRLTSKEINTFLKHWMSNDLKFGNIFIEMDAFNLEMFDEIPVIKRSNDVKRIMDQTLAVDGGFDIKRNDGVTATIVYNETFIRFKTFCMIVWDNLSV
uniref:FBA_2 domain-containing protein n=2 Tax=Caenorhabditis tropicalis TaxID=1561998 RepID=A0A1I7UV28_9PELO